MRLRARYVVPVATPTIKNGAVGVSRGRIANVDLAKHVDSAPTVDFGDAAILPGFINAHTHLELTCIAGRVPPGHDLADWLAGVMGEMGRLDDPAAARAQGAIAGAKRSLQHGVTTVADVTSQPRAVRPVLRAGPLRVVSFGEVIAIGTRRRSLGERLEAAADGACCTDYLSVGISPHAPYSIEADGAQACAQRAQALDLPLCVHLAESRDESRFTLAGDGPLRDLLGRLGVWDDLITCPRLTPVAAAHAWNLLTPRTLAAHCNHVANDEINWLARSGVHVVYCPRTHAAFGHPPHPFQRMLDAGLNVCLGTDSLASSPSLSILDELRFVHQRCPQMAPARLLAMATVRPAAALRLANDIGSLETGKSADLTVVPLDPAGPGDALANVLQSTLAPVATYIRGRRADRV